MKLISLTIFALLASNALALLGPAAKSNEEENRVEEGALPKERRRRRLNAGCINNAIACSLPTINAIISEKIEDPIDINRDVEKDLEISDGPCDGELAAVA